MAARLYEVRVEATVYVLAESEAGAEDIAESGAERDWFEGWARGPVEADQIDRDWRDVPPLRDYGEDDTGETCAQIAEREAREREAEAREREVAARQARLPGVTA